MRLNAIIGVAGVNPQESGAAKRVGRFFEVLVLLALIVVFAQLMMLYSGMLTQANWLTHIVWFIFFLELVFNLYNVKDRGRYIKENWLNILIVFIAFPLIEWGNDWATIIRSLRLLLFVRFFTGFSKDFVSILNRNRFGQILVATAFVVLAAGAMFAYIENRSLWEGVWYALVTITTVGYGDVTPVSDAGRAFGIVLIVFGVVFFSLVTANISAFLIGSDQERLERDILGYVKQTEKRLAQQQADNEAQVEKIMLHMSKEIESLKEELKQSEARLANMDKTNTDKPNKDKLNKD